MADAKIFVVTLDGPAGAGKSTTAGRLAGELGIAVLDTGAMFRAAAQALGEGAADWPQARLQERLGAFDFSLAGSGAKTRLLLNGRPLPPDIRSEHVALLASKIAAVPCVRAFMRLAQVELGAETSLVAEGRDMGTVVFPEALCKFFLDAAPEERATRRCRQLAAAGREADYDAVLVGIRCRDEQDRNRPIAPLRPAEGAVVVDTTHLTEDEVLAILLKDVRAALAHA